MKVCRFAVLALAALMLSGACGAATEFKNGTAFALGSVPKELVVERRAGEPVRFSLEENPTTGFTWEVESNTNECEIALERRGRGGKTTCGAPGKLDVTVTSRIYTPARVEFRYRRPWEKDADPWKTMRLIVYTVGEAKDPRYPKTPVNLLLEMEEYFAHVMKILDEPISIYANPTYLPTPIAAEYDRLWTEERMRAVIAKCIEKGIAIEIQAESAFPRPSFLRLAKGMGAKFSFGTNNFDPGPKDLSKWLEAIVWLDLGPSDIWTPAAR